MYLQGSITNTNRLLLPEVDEVVDVGEEGDVEERMLEANSLSCLSPSARTPIHSHTLNQDLLSLDISHRVACLAKD